MSLKLPSDFAKKIGESFNWKLSQVEETFSFEEDKAGFFWVKMKPKKFLDMPDFKGLCRLVEGLDGCYLAGLKSWRLPGPCANKEPAVSKSSSKPEFTQKSTPISTPEPKKEPISTPLDEDTQSLKDSAKKIGALYPVLIDSHGNTIDGFHRLKANPDWPTLKVDSISDPVQLEMARLAANACRREVPAEEKRDALDKIAEMTGWTPKEIADNLGMSERWVYLYLSGDFKGTEPAQLTKGREESQEALHSASLALNTPSQEIRQAILCERCGESIQGDVLHLDGKFYDEDCAEIVKAEKTPSVESQAEAGPIDKEPAADSDLEEPEKPDQEEKKAIQFIEFDCTECHRHFLVEHWPSGKHVLKEIREGDSL